MTRKLVRPGFPPITVNEGYPPAPEGIPFKRWFDCQLALKDKGVPHEVIKRITTLRRMNMWVIMVVQIGNPWRVIVENEPELMKKYDPKEFFMREKQST